MSRPVYKKDLIYLSLRPYVDYCTRSVYGKSIIKGEENLPDDGAIILAPNHCNALMDALVILRAFKDGTVFGARADIFRKPLFAKALHFLKILPMVRMRDGLHNVIRNRQTTEDIIESLDHGVRFCMFSEGTHRTKHSLLPIGKGIFRIAIEAAERFGDRKPVYVVPVGLEYGDYHRYKSTSILSFGKPINITEFLKESSGSTEADIYRRLREILRERIAGMITCLKDDEHYDEKWTLTRVASASYLSEPEELLDNNRRYVRELEKRMDDAPEKTSVLLGKAKEFEAERLEAKVSYFSFGNETSVPVVVFKTLTAIVGLPYFIWCAVVCLPMWAAAEWLCNRKIKDKAFHNTARFGVKLALSPVMIAIWAAVFFTTLPWQFATLLLLVNLASYSKFYEYKKFVRILFSDYRLLANEELRNNFNELKKL